MPCANNNNNTYQVVSASSTQAQVTCLTAEVTDVLCRQKLSAGSHHSVVAELGFEPWFASEVCVVSNHPLWDHH